MKTVDGHTRTHTHTHTLKWHVCCGEVIHCHPKPDAVIRKSHTMISAQLSTRKPKQRERRTFRRRTSPTLSSWHVCSRFRCFVQKSMTAFCHQALIGQGSCETVSSLSAGYSLASTNPQSGRGTIRPLVKKKEKKERQGRPFEKQPLSAAR